MLLSVGAIYETTSRPKTAFHYYSRSLDTSERLGDAVGQARVWLDLGRLLTNAVLPAARRSAATACYRAALRLTSGDVGHLHVSTAAAAAAAATETVL